MYKLRIALNISKLSIVFKAIGSLIWWVVFGIRPYALMKLNYTHSNDLIRRLKSTGVEIVHGNQSFVDFANTFNKQIESEFIEKQKEEMTHNEKANNFSRDIAPSLSEDIKLKLIKFALSDESLGLVALYLGFVPKISSLKVMLNIPSKKSKRGSQLWHRDGMVHKGMNVFIALTEISPDLGMYSAIPFSQFKRSEVIIPSDNGTGWDQDRITESEMRRYVLDENVDHFIGKPGAYALVDNGWIYHEGGYLNKGHRLMIEISYQAITRNKNAIEKPVCELWQMDFSSIVEKLKLNSVQKYALAGLRPVGFIGHWLYKIDRFLVFEKKSI